MDNYDFLFNVITTIAGIYVLYVWFRLKKEGQLFENQLLIPKGSKLDECLDTEGYIAYFSPRLLILGIACTLTGGICVLDSRLGFLSVLFPQVEKISFYVDLGGQLLALAILIWYIVCCMKSRKKYWL